jgi:hypothetical protein
VIAIAPFPHRPLWQLLLGAAVAALLALRLLSG